MGHIAICIYTVQYIQVGALHSSWFREHRVKIEQRIKMRGVGVGKEIEESKTTTGHQVALLSTRYCALLPPM